MNATIKYTLIALAIILVAALSGAICDRLLLDSVI